MDCRRSSGAWTTFAFSSLSAIGSLGPAPARRRAVPTRRVWLACAMAGVLVACESLPGTRTQQSTAAGAVAGAAVGAVVAGEGNRLAGALLGAAVGAAGGYLIGARTSWFDDDDSSRAALDAVSDAKRDPATAEDARRASTADINEDGFVTLDELVAMDAAGFDDRVMLARLRATGQVFELNDEQEAAVIAAGVSPYVVSEMQRIRVEEKARVLADTEQR